MRVSPGTRLVGRGNWSLPSSDHWVGHGPRAQTDLTSIVSSLVTRGFCLDALGNVRFLDEA